MALKSWKEAAKEQRGWRCKLQSQESDPATNRVSTNTYTPKHNETSKNYFQEKKF